VSGGSSAAGLGVVDRRYRIPVPILIKFEKEIMVIGMSAVDSLRVFFSKQANI
jgi:hypothetical protein